jgi:hypothetical protein
MGPVSVSPFFGKNLELVEGLARRLDPRRSDITRRYRTSVGRARCLVMSKTRAFRTSFLRLAEAISVLARASFNYSIFSQRRRLRAARWAKKDLNFRPHAYQACALTN